jgi:hypothetical protein
MVAGQEIRGRQCQPVPFPAGLGRRHPLHNRQRGHLRG